MLTRFCLVLIETYLKQSTFLICKMGQEKMRMPSGMGGLVRYFDEYKSKIELKPGHIILLCVIVVIIMILLYTYGNSWLGI